MKTLLLATLLVTTYVGVNGQSSINSEKAINQFIRQYNNQQIDSVYHSFSPEYTSKPPLEIIRAILSKVYEANGKVKSRELRSFQNEKYTYLLACEKGAFQVSFRVDSNSLINGMMVTPAQKKSTTSKIFPSDNSLASGKDMKINEHVQNFLNSNKCPGLSIAIIDGQRVVYYNYGETKSGSGKLPNAQSVYDIGSITKTFTAAVFEKLIEKKIVRLQDSLGKFIPELSPQIASIKIVHLLNHTSGLPSMPAPPENSIQGKDPFENYSKANLLKDLKSIQLQSVPGELFSYSNLGFATLGLIVESVTRKPYGTMVKNSVIKPLHLKATSLDPSSVQESNLTQGFTNGASVDYVKLDAMNAAGGLKSTVTDLATFISSMFHSDGTKESLVEKPTYTQANGVQVGLSWLIKKSDNLNIYFHNGGTTGYRSFIGFDPVVGKGVVILSNSANDVTKLGFDLMNGL